MSTDGETTSDAQAQPRRRTANRRSAKFILVFAISVYVMLTGYRFMIGTKLNDWYLFQVAGHAAMALNCLGDSAALEGRPLSDEPAPKKLRATLAAWGRGDAAPTADDETNAADGPITTWERYQYKLQKMRRAAPGNTKLGPYVSLIWRSGWSTEVQDIDRKLEEAKKSGADKDPAKKAELDALRTRSDELRQKMVTAAKDLKAPQDPAQVFGFNVISECSAIEVMAIFFSAVIAFPASWRKRIIGLVVGLPLMYLLNITRLVVLGIIGALDKNRDVFNFMHEYVWQAVYIVFVVVVWMIWIELVVRGKEKSS